ncbi:MAG: hypothetical protein CMM53_06935 [Rhodospirillaceae bacterium]|nr:hypothetical protein [Rhodospirillaceae bacterium]
MKRAPSQMSQVPSGSEIFLDHVGWFVPEMNAVGPTMERLGFCLTPFVAQHNADPNGGAPIPAGTGNRCAMLERGYLEFLSAVPSLQTPLSEQLKAALKRYHGVHLLAFTINDSQGAFERLKVEDFSPLDPIHLRRPLTLNNGKNGEVAFTVIRVPPNKMPEGRIQILRQETPELVWQDNLIARDNGISALGGVILCVNDIEEVANRFSKFTGKKIQGSEDYISLDLDRGRICFTNRDYMQSVIPNLVVPTTPFMAAVTLESRDLEKTRTFINKAGITFKSLSDHTILLSQDNACGVSLIIFDKEDIWPRKS